MLILKMRDVWFILLTVLFICYLYVLIKVILFKFGPVDLAYLESQLRRLAVNSDHMRSRLDFANFVPFRSINQNINRLSNHHDLVNLFGNIAIFAPLGIFVGLMAKGKAVGVFLTSLGVSLSLECAQIVFSMGSFDVDDLILNTFGGLLGYGAYFIMKRLLRIKPKPNLTSSATEEVRFYNEKSLK